MWYRDANGNSGAGGNILWRCFQLDILSSNVLGSTSRNSLALRNYYSWGKSEHVLSKITSMLKCLRQQIGHNAFKCIHQLWCARLHLLCQGIDITVTQRGCVILATVEFHHVFLLSANQRSCDPFLSQPEKAKWRNSTTWPNLTASPGGGVL